MDSETMNDQKPPGYPCRLDRLVRRFSVEIRQEFEYGQATTCKREEEFGEEDGGEPECLASVVAAAVVASMPYRTWVRYFTDAFVAQINEHLDAEGIE